MEMKSSHVSYILGTDIPFFPFILSAQCELPLGAGSARQCQDSLTLCQHGIGTVAVV